MEPQPDGQIRFANQHPLITTWLARRSEPFRWGCLREALPELLGKFGLESREVCTPDWYRTQYLLPLGQQRQPLAEGDYLCHAVHTSS
jgi:hypothetical protein